VLEVKGDFCYRVREILRKHGREGDYIELSLDCPYRYNPLYNDLEAYALAYGIASLLTNLFGRGKEPFWQQAYTNVVKFIVLLHKSVYGYVTLFDVYECAINPDLLAQRIAEGQALFEPGEFLLVDPPDYYDAPELKAFDFEMDPALDRMKVPRSDEVEHKLNALGIPYTTQGSPTDGNPHDSNRREQFEAVERWFHHDWMRIEPKLRTSIVEGISVFLSLFDDSPAVKRTFCPPKECYDPVANADGRYGKPLPPFAELVETGAVVALNFPVASNPGLAKAIGVFLKQDFQRAMLGRIPKMEAAPERHWREVMFLCDEYHAFATVGESDPSGDEKFFSLSRQARCIPIIATQSISSLRSALPGDAWRTLLQTFRTKLFLTLSDDFSMSVASELCGKDEQLKEQYSIAENSQDARVSLFTGRATSNKSAITTTKSYDIHRLSVFEPKIFAELKNAQAIALAYDGLNPLPPSYCYLKPYYLDPNRSYFEQLARGEI
ncbi:MAG: TraM recognition domain-containing protein, partial [Acidobacteria bacterium]|nr:TraM recognition domain-containing protein [Acidobacteriota bacterium]